MAALVAVPLVLVVTIGIGGGRWIRSRRRDDRSISAHRSTLGVMEHLAGTEEPLVRSTGRISGHVRIVAGPADGTPRPARDSEVVPAQVFVRRTDLPSFPRPKDRALRPPEPPVERSAPPAPATKSVRVARSRPRPTPSTSA